MPLSTICQALWIAPISGVSYKDPTQEDSRKPNADQPSRRSGLQDYERPVVGTLTFVPYLLGQAELGRPYAELVPRKTEERVGRMLLMHANNREEIKEASAGDIVAARRSERHHAPATRCAIRQANHS
jgi:elongation factor G